MQRVIADRTNLAARLKDLTSKQTIPIEPPLQGHFTRLLLEAGTGAGALMQRRHDAQWASELTEPPACWEQRLHALACAVEECQGVHRQLAARSEALAEHTAALTLQSQRP